MMEQCPKCNHKFAKYPYKDEQGKLIIKNLLKVDLMSILFFICVIFLIIGYKSDMAQCHDAIKYPCTFCEKSNCCMINKNILNRSQVQSYSTQQVSFNFTIPQE